MGVTHDRIEFSNFSTDRSGFLESDLPSAALNLRHKGICVPKTKLCQQHYILLLFHLILRMPIHVFIISIHYFN